MFWGTSSKIMYFQSVRRWLLMTMLVDCDYHVLVIMLFLNCITVFIFKKSFKDIERQWSKRYHKSFITGNRQRRKARKQWLPQTELSYDKNMKCLRAVVPNFELRTKIGALCDLNTDDMSHYSYEDYIDNNTRMHLTFIKEDLDTTKNWIDIGLEDIISKSIGMYTPTRKLYEYKCKVKLLEKIRVPNLKLNTSGLKHLSQSMHEPVNHVSSPKFTHKSCSSIEFTIRNPVQVQ